MRISYITETYPPEVNGVALTVERTVRDLRKRGHFVDLIRPHQRNEAPLNSDSEWRTAGAPIPMYPELRFGLAFAHTLRKRFERRQPDLVHLATPGPLAHAAMRAARALQIPVTMDFRTNFHGYGRYYGLGFVEPLIQRYLRSLHNQARLSFVPTQALRQQLLAQGFQRLAVVSRGVDALQFSPERRSAELRAQWGVRSDDTPVLLHVGRLAPEKNLRLALRTHAAVRHVHPDARLVMVGDGPLRRSLGKSHPDVHFAGTRRGDDLAQHYASADLFVFPSRSETFGNVALEAMASGLSVVAFNLAAAGDHIQSGHNGWLAPDGDDNAFVAAACQAAADCGPAAALRTRARKKALSAQWSSVLHGFDLHLARVARGEESAGTPHVALA